MGGWIQFCVSKNATSSTDIETEDLPRCDDEPGSSTAYNEIVEVLLDKLFGLGKACVTSSSSHVSLNSKNTRGLEVARGLE